MVLASPRLLFSVALSLALPACAESPPPPSLSMPTRDESTSLPSPTGAEPAARSETGSVPPFDRGAAARALASVDVSSCAASGGPTGPGHVTLVMATDGGVSSVRVDKAPYSDTIVGACVAEKFRGVRVPAFDGPPVPIGKSFRME